jgi:hypothetical protein
MIYYIPASGRLKLWSFAHGRSILLDDDSCEVGSCGPQDMESWGWIFVGYI